MISRLILILSISLLSSIVRADSTERAIYDQRQSGHYNIHINIKDVAIFDMEGNDFTDHKPGLEDYYYDDSDLTIKPIGAWLSSKPTTSPDTSITPPTTNFTSVSNISNYSASLNTSTVSSTHSVTLITTPTPIVTEINIANNINSSHQQFTDELPKPMSTTKKPNVLIIGTDTPMATKPTLKPFQFPGELGALIPVHVLSDPFLQKAISRPSLRLKDSTRSHANVKNQHGLLKNAGTANNCRRGQVMDIRGNCRTRRSSFLGKIMRAFKSLTPSED